MTLLKLCFIYAYPLDRGRRGLFEEKGLAYPSMEEVSNVLKHWEFLWVKTNNEKNILATLAELTGRVPERNLECFVFGAGLGAMSTPFLLPIWNKAGEQWSDEKFIDLIIHELLHIFLVTNNEQYWESVKEKFSEEEPVCRNHILLYAMLCQIYQKLFNKEPIDFNRDNLPPGYARAIQIVRETGYEELIAEYQKFI
ncbi:MAG: hypothetical protein KDD45_00015 [Bdellovibrionales bacterium]|nr:hypothetical protein [Bdellovibrionales bacterium]